LNTPPDLTVFNRLPSRVSICGGHGALGASLDTSRRLALRAIEGADDLGVTDLGARFPRGGFANDVLTELLRSDGKIPSIWVSSLRATSRVRWSHSGGACYELRLKKQAQPATYAL
jgi:hypothetical protein